MVHSFPADAHSGERVLGWAFLAFGLGDALLALAFDFGLSCGVIGVALQLVATAGAASVAVSWLMSSLSRDGSRRLRLASELADVSDVLAEEQSMRHRLTHDARNVVAAIRTATITLERHGDRLEPVVQERLRDTVGSEFDRLQDLFEQPGS
jgi:signal transduction histidine kinase